MPKIAVMGDRETVMGFKALGLDVYPVVDPADAKSIFHRLQKPESDYAIIYVEETIAQHLSSEIEKCNDRPVPAVIMIPGREGALGIGRSALETAMKRAIG